MRHPLIIDARRHLSLNRRLFSDASTLALWSMWLWLWRSALVRMIGLLGVTLGLLRAGKYVAAGKGLAIAGTMLSIEDAALVLVGTCGTLMLWNRLASQPAPTPQIHAVPDYPGYFGVAADELEAARSSHICTVHHDESGRILRIDSK